MQRKVSKGNSLCQNQDSHSKQTIKVPVSQHFTAAARTFTNSLKRPGVLLEFLTSALTWAYDQKEDDQKVNLHLYLTLMMECIVAPWFDGGKNVVNNIAKGIDDICDFGEAIGYHDALGSLLVAFGKNQHEFSFNKEMTETYLNIIHTLFQLEYAMNDYQKEETQGLRA